MTTTIVFDDAAGFLTKQSFDAVYGSLGKQKGVNEIELHSALAERGFAKNRLSEYKGRIEFQKELERYNREILDNEFSSGNKKIDISSLNTGMYFLLLTTDKGNVTKKVIIE